MTAVATLAMVAISVAGCGGDHASDSAGWSAEMSRSAIRVTSPDFADGALLPARYTCHGAGISPPLRFSGVPTGAAALALIVTDPDAPAGTFTHWVLFDLPPQVHELAPGSVPPQARQATNSAGRLGYSPPCPPSGTHHYRFTLVALRDRIELADGAPHERVIQQIRAEALARGTLVVTVTHS